MIVPPKRGRSQVCGLGTGGKWRLQNAKWQPPASPAAVGGEEAPTSEPETELGSEHHLSSLSDSVNSRNIKHADGLFAHVVTANKRTYGLVEKALVSSGLPISAINLVAVPSELGLFDDVFHLGGQVRLGTYFEVVLRLFRFRNQTAGDEYLKSSPPVYYVKGEHSDNEPLEAAKTPRFGVGVPGLVI